MPERERFAELLESLADGTPVDWTAVDAAAVSEDDRAWLQQLRRLELAVVRQRRSPARGATWSHLELIERIGAGAFGEVYRAHDPRLARDVALKLLFEPMGVGDARASAVIEEGRLLARVRHPNVVTVYGAECRDGQVGIWTEFIDGQTLQTRTMERGPLPAAEVTAIGIDLCRALAAVHSAGLLHRDIKAQNVMREASGRIVLMDFGTGRDLEPLPGQKTDVSGTPLYLAPELFTGGEASAASDIYALGVLVFFLLTGKYPVTGQTLADVRDGHLTGRAPALRDLGPAAPAALVTAIDRALSREPSMRFASAREFEQALVRAQSASPDGELTRRWYRWRAWSLAAALLILGMAATAAWWWGNTDRGLGVAIPVTGTALPAGTPSVKLPAPSDASASARQDSTSELAPAPVASLSGDSAEPARVLPRFHLTEDDKASISEDGRFIAMPERDATGALTGDLAILNLSTHVSSPLQLPYLTRTEWVRYPTLSRDGRFLAFRWEGPGGGRLRVFDHHPVKDEPADRVVVDDPQTRIVGVHDWSPHNDRVLVTARSPAGFQLAWASRKDGTVTTIKPYVYANEQIVEACVSRDGDYVAYMSHRGRTTYLSVISADGKEDAEISMAMPSMPGVASDIRHPSWSPDGSELFYIASTNGALDLWAIPVRRGRAAGRGHVVRRAIGTGHALGFGGGAYYFTVDVPATDNVFVGAVPEEGRVGRRFEVATEIPGGLLPTWSADGRSLAVVKRNTVTGSSFSLAVHNFDKGSEAIYGQFTTPPATPMFFLDPRTLIGQRTVDDVRRLDRIQVRGAGFAIGNSVALAFRLLPATALSRDGTQLYGFLNQSSDPSSTIDRLVAVNLTTGAPTPIYTLPDELRLKLGSATIGLGLALSPDGSELAIAVHPPNSPVHLFRIGVDGRFIQDVCPPYAAGSAFGKIAWSNRGIYYAESAPTSWRIMRVPEDGKPRPVLDITGSDSEAYFAVSPDGARVAIHPNRDAVQSFSTSAGGATHELWKLLPKPGGSRRP